MEDKRFDQLTKGFAQGGFSRRGFVRGLVGALVGGIGAERHADAFICRAGGVLCAENAQCCSHQCESFHCTCEDPQQKLCGDRCADCCSNSDCPGQNEICQNGTCVSTCVPDCTGKNCGDNSCGGSCGTCGAGQSCQDGICTCPAGTCGTNCANTLCGNDCVDTSNDVHNCGGCGKVCHLNETCSGGKCGCPGCTQANFTCCSYEGGACSCSGIGGPDYLVLNTSNNTCVVAFNECPSGTTACVGPSCQACCPDGTTCDSATGNCFLA